MPRRAPGHRRFTLVFCLLAAAAVLSVYRHVWDYYLYNDDFRWMHQARYEMNAGNILGFQVIGFFRPVMNVMFYATERMMPNNLHAYYATNLLLHFANGMLVFALLARWFRDRWLAAGTALFFLISCTHWAAVGWISGRTTLVSTAFLLSALLVLVGRPAVGWRRWCATGLYVLALASKEEAVVGILLLALVWLARRRGENTLPDRRTLVYFAAVTLVYVAVRTMVIGHVTQENWAPGAHALRNLGGGFLYHVYPWAPASLVGAFESFRVSDHALWPEILAVPALILLWGAGRTLGRGREVLAGLAWTLIALLPVSMFTFRFFATDWLTHDRYYYLSSVGSCLCIVSILAGLWNVVRRRGAARVVVAAAVLVIVIGEPQAVDNRAGRFRRMTRAYLAMVNEVSRHMSRHDTYNTCAIHNWPLQRPFVQDVFSLVEPGWRVVAIDSEEETLEYRPCLYVRVFIDGNRMTTRAASVK